VTAQSSFEQARQLVVNYTVANGLYAVVFIFIQIVYVRYILG